MKRILLLLIIIILLVGGSYGYISLYNHKNLTNFQISPKQKRYVIYKEFNPLIEAEQKDEAINEAKKHKRTIVVDTKESKWIYSSLQPYLIFNKKTIHDFKTFDDALRYAKKNNYNKIYFKDENNIVWEKEKMILGEKKLEVPLLSQLPELDRGCEVTSLAMILNYFGYNVNKLELAEKIKKDTTPYLKDKDGKIYYGNPYEGFVGDIYDINKNGYGVYHGPIAELAGQYVENNVIDLTGAEFDDLLYFIDRDKPVWIVINGSFKQLKDDEFEIWHTPKGLVKTTKRMHSVVITGYDKEYIFINDPLYSRPNRKIKKLEFIKAWEQMGSQAVVILD